METQVLNGYTMVKVNLNTQVFIGFLLAIFLVLVLSYIAFTNQKHSQAATTLVARSTKALYYAREAFSVALDVDMSQRAYVLTGDTSFVQPYRYAVETIPRHISDLRKLAKGQPAQLTRLATFESLVDQRLALARETINAHDKAHVQSAPRVNTSLRGTMIMDEIRQIFLGFQAEEKGLLKTRSVRQAALLDSYNKSLNALYAAVAVVLVTLLLLIYKNLQARSKAERLLQKRSEEIKDLYNNAPCGYQSLNANGVIVEMNDTLLRWLGYEHKQVVNVLKFRDLLTESGRLVFQKNFTLFKVQGFLTDQQFDLMRKDGGFIPVLVNSVAIFDDQGNYTKSRSSLFDIRQIKLMEAQLNEARQNAETANITKSQFLANMSHEIRTPLNAVIGLSHLALKTQLSAKQFDYLKKIQSSSESLLGIVNDILDFSKIESGKMTLEEGKFDLEEVFQKLADVITYKAQAKGLEIAFGIDSRVPTNLIGDAVRLEHVLSNLCSNAVKFTDKGEVVVNVRLLEDAGDDLKVQFKVKDTGIGMDKVQMSKLFEPFSQADETISRKYGGTGLGLSIIKRLVELMNGEVSVKSEPGKGSSFYFSVWLKRQKDQRKFPVPSVDLRKLSVLLVDDNKSALQILKRALQSFSFKVITISSGIQAVHFLKNNRHTDPVQLVLMDWKMPGMDGLEAAEIIRQDPELADVRIIMMCNSYGHENLYQKVEDLGLAGVVTKPIRYSLLYDAIMSAIEGGVVNQHEKERRETGASVKHHLRSAKLLLVEDNDINQQVATELLQGMGFVVEIANNGLEAVNMVRNSGVPSRYDLVLMDLQMPVMGGLMATSEIRKIPAYENLPIIAMTADAMVGVQEKCLEAGMLDFISKPINPDMMFETIEKWIVTKPNPGTADLPAIQKAEDVEIPIHDMEGVDIEDGLRHVAGNRKLYLELLTKFFRSNEHFAAIVKNKWLAGSADESLRMMHTLKGLSGNLGMLNLHEACKRSEKALGADGVDDVHAVLGPVEEQLNIVIRSLKTNLVKAETPVHEIELGKVLPMVDQLEKLLRDNDPEAVNVLKQIGRVNGYEKEFQEVSTLLQDYDFEKALEFLKIIKVNLK